MANTKITRREMMTAMAIALEGAREQGLMEEIEGIQTDLIIADIHTVLEQMDRRNEKANARRAAKKAEHQAEADALTQQIAGIVTDELMTGDQITELIGNPEVTKGKVVARLKTLIADGIVVKEPQRIEKRQVMCYRLA